MIGPQLPKGDFNALVGAVAGRFDPDDLAGLVTKCGRAISDITVTVKNPLLTQRVLKHAEEEEWAGELLDVILEESNPAALVQLVQHTRALWDAAVLAAEAYAPAGQARHALVLFNRAPFVNRGTERPLLDDVVAFNGRRVLVVRGDKDVGKSHLEQFARHLVGYQPGTRMATLRMEDIEGTVVDDKGVALIGAMDLMGAIVSRMGVGSDNGWDALAQEQRQAGKLVDWLVGRTQSFADAGVRWVIVIDTANHPKAGPGALELTARLIMAAARGELVDTCLIVLALPKEVDVPPVVATMVGETTLLPLTRSEVRTFIAELAAAMRRDPAAADLDALENHAVRQLAFPLDRAGMDTLRQRLAEVHDSLVRFA